MKQTNTYPNPFYLPRNQHVFVSLQPEADPEPDTELLESSDLVRFTNIGTCASAFGDPSGPTTGEAAPFPPPPGDWRPKFDELPLPDVGEMTPIIELDAVDADEVLRGI